VRSPWCDEGEQELKDFLRLHDDGRFTHEGRRDDVVKVAGKRASIGALEDLLRKLPGVADVAIWQDTDGPSEARLRYAIAVAPRAIAVPPRAIAVPPRAIAVASAPAEGHRETSLTKQAIAAAVSREFDPVFAPRQVVFVEALPRDATGKLPKESLARLFRKPKRSDDASAYASRLPLSRAAGGSVECTLPENFVFFQGHFPGLPILPGAALLDRVVLPAVRLDHPDLGAVAGLQRVRFVKNVCPTQHVAVHVTRSDLRVAFEVRGAGGVVATGVLLFRASSSP
jgi:hypothetical protein